MKRTEYYTFRKPGDWTDITIAYKTATKQTDKSNFSIAATLVDKFYPESSKWKSVRLQLIKNLHLNVWYDVKYEL